MNSINRLLVNICSRNLIASKQFYTSLFNFKVTFESDWFIQLMSDKQNFEIGIIDESNQLIPEDFQKPPQGFYITFVVENVDEVFELAKSNNFDIIQPPKDAFYGQRRLLLKDPDGSLVDVSSLIS